MGTESAPGSNRVALGWGSAPVRLIPSLATPTSAHTPPAVPRRAPHPGPEPGAQPALPQPAAAAPSPTTLPPRPSAPGSPGRGTPTAKAANSARSSRCPRFSRAPGPWGWEPESGRAFSYASPNLDYPRQQRVVASESLSGRGRSQPGSSPASATRAWAPRKAARLPPPRLRLLSCCRATRPPHPLWGPPGHQHSPHPQRLLPTLTFASRSWGPCEFCIVDAFKRGSDRSRVIRESCPWHGHL